MKKFLIAIAFAFAIGAVASTAKADTTADIMAQIAALQAQLSGSMMTTGYAFSADLTIGSTGSDVVALQDLLISKGYLTIPAGVAKGYFGQLTKSATAAWQASVGLPATGYFGPLSRAKVAGMGTTTTTTTTTTTPVCPTGFTCVSNTTTTTTTSGNGDEGQLDNVKTIGGTDSSVEEGEEDSKVLGVQVEAQDSDMEIERVDVDFDLDAISGAASQNLNHYIDSVTLWLDGKELDTQDVDEGDEEDNVFSFRFTGLNGKIAEDKTAKLYVSVTAVSSIDSDDIGEDIIVLIPDDGIRAVDEAGISDTYGENLDDSFNVGERSEGDLSLTSDDDDNRTISVDDEDSTDDVSLLKFEIESKDQMNTINEITVKIATTSGKASDIIDTLYLFANGEEVGSESVDAGGPDLAAITFDDIDLDIDEDDTVDFEVRADLASVEDNYSNGATIQASVAKADVDAEDEAGDDTEVSGGDVTGGIITLRTAGVMVEQVSPAPKSEQALGLDSTATDDQGKYTITFSVSAFEDPAYVALTATRGTAISGGASYTIESASNGYTASTSGTVSAELRHVSGGSEVSSYVKINDGQTATFELTVYFDSALTDIYRAQLYGVNFASTSVAADTQEVVTPSEEFQTPGVQVKN